LSVTEKFTAISQLFPNRESYVYHGFLFPLLTVLVYIFVYPYPSKFIYSFWRRRQKELLEVRQRIENETCLTVEQSRAIYAQMYRLQEDHQKELLVREAEIARLRKELENNKIITIPKEDEAPSEVVQPQATLSSDDKDDQVTDLELSFLQTLSKKDPESIHEGSFRNYFTDPMMAKYHLENLVQKHFVTKAGMSYSLTQRGREFIISRRKE
jgi:hypothetical protein